MPTPSQFQGLPWWEVPSQYWNYGHEGSLIQNDWMSSLAPGAGYSYADYQTYLNDLAAQGLISWSPSGQPQATNTYYQQYHNTSFTPVMNAAGKQTGAIRDYTYQPQAPVQTPSVAGAAYAEQYRQRQPAASRQPRPSPRTGLGGY